VSVPKFPISHASTVRNVAVVLPRCEIAHYSIDMKLFTVVVGCRTTKDNQRQPTTTNDNQMQKKMQPFGCIFALFYFVLLLW
jgi:hypothetical protein